MIVIAKDIVVLESGQLFASDECGHLWTAKLDLSKREKTPRYLEITVKFIDDLLGSSTSLTSDPDGSLYYYLPRDGAVVRWNSRFEMRLDFLTQILILRFFLREPLNAEHHEVLYLSSTPIVEIIFGSKGSVWIVKETPNYFDDHCKRILLHF